jgi:predicted O-methyltransferase YrrM
MLAARRTKTVFRAMAVEAGRQGPALAQVRRVLESAATGAPVAADRRLWARIEAIRAVLLARDDCVEELDFGAGSTGQQYSEEEQRRGVVTMTPVRAIAEFSKPAPWAEILFHLTRARKPQRVLELGTCVGISGSYIASALRLNGQGRLWTLEGSPATTRLAQETFVDLGLTDWVTSLVGPFHQTLGPCLAEHGPFDLVFIDGHHDGKATVDYFEQIKPHAGVDALLIFDDIAWSPDMARAWEVVSADAAVKAQVRLGGMGAVVL